MDGRTDNLSIASMQTAKQTRFIESFITMTLQAEQISNLSKREYWLYRAYDAINCNLNLYK